jgi:hypothetical protein
LSATTTYAITRSKKNTTFIFFKQNTHLFRRVFDVVHVVKDVLQARIGDSAGRFGQANTFFRQQIADGMR